MNSPLPLGKSSSSPWSRLKPAQSATDPLESMGFVSKGDTRLLDFKTQESYYSKIVTRYMQFCASHSIDLDAAFASLSISPSSSTDSAINPSTPKQPIPSPSTPSLRTPYVPPRKRSAFKSTPYTNGLSTPPPTSSDPSPAAIPSTVLSLLLLSLRKLREALLSTKRLDAFVQRAHLFSIRLSLLATHPPSYAPSLFYLLHVIHPVTPLPKSELSEFTTYAILDAACRLQDYHAAYSLRHISFQNFGYSDRHVDATLSALVHDNFILFWRTRRKVDGYQKRLLGFAEDGVRKVALKSLGRAYLGASVSWVEVCAGGEEIPWDELVKREGIGWLREGSNVIIRKVKAKEKPAQVNKMTENNEKGTDGV